VAAASHDAMNRAHEGSVGASEAHEEGAGGPLSEAKTLSVASGRPFRITLWEDRTRGELWVPAYDPAALVLTDDDFSRTASGNAMEAGRRTFEFQPVQSGTHRILFEKRLGWKFTAEDRRVFLIAVTDGVQPLESS
jgi:predicted secreted protein